MVLLPVVIIANLAVRERWAHYTTLAIAAGASVLVGFSGLFGVLGATASGAGAQELPSALILLLAGAVLVPAVQSVLARYLPLDPNSAPALLALVGVILIVGEQASYQASHDALAVVGRAPQLEPLDVVLQELPL